MKYIKYIKYIIFLFILFFFIYLFYKNNEYFDNFNINLIKSEEVNSEENVNLYKNIFIYWHEKEITNQLVKRNIEYLREKLPSDYTLHIYNEENIKKELSKKEMKHLNESKQHFADYVRLLLLNKYGGYWLDSTILLPNINILNKIYEEYENNHFDVFLFEYSEKNNGNEIYGKYLENWFIVAPKNSIFIKDMLREYKKALNIGFLKYKKMLIKENINIGNLFSDKKDVYLMQHAIIRKLVSKNKYKISYEYAQNSMFAIQEKCKWNNDCLLNDLKNFKNIDNNENIYGIKLVGGQRDFISSNENKDYINNIFSSFELPEETNYYIYS